MVVSGTRTSVRVMKRCLRCERDKPLSDFHRWSRRDGTQPWCKECRKAYDREYHQRVKARRKEQQAARRAAFLKWYRALKESLTCTDCGQRVHHAAMTFDHLPGSAKRGDVADLVGSASRQLVLAEIALCEPVCANCHAVRTFERRRRGVAQPG